MDPASVIGVLASIVTLIETGKRVYERLRDLQKFSNKLSRSLQDSVVLLPVLLSIVNNYKRDLEKLGKETSSAKDVDSQTSPSQGAIIIRRPSQNDQSQSQPQPQPQSDGHHALEDQQLNLKLVFDGCLKTIEELEHLIEEAVPQTGNSKLKQYSRMFRQARARKLGEEVHKSLENYRSTLALHMSYTILVLTQRSQNAIARSVSILHTPEEGGYYVYTTLESLSSWLVGLCTLQQSIREEIDGLLENRSPQQFEMPVVDLFGRNEIITELALLGYLDHCRQRYKGIFLVDCSDETSKEKSFNDIFSSINRDQRSFPTVKQKIKFVQWMLAKWSEPYLMVFHQGSGNLSGESVAQYFPPGGNGAILVTSKIDSKHSHSLKLPPTTVAFDVDEIIELRDNDPLFIEFAEEGAQNEAGNGEVWDEDTGQNAQEVEQPREESAESKRLRVLFNMDNLIETYINQGRISDAFNLRIKLVERAQDILGYDHSFTLVHMDSLARDYQKRGDLNEAERISTQVVDKSIALHGRRSTEAIAPMRRLAKIVKAQGRWEEAQKLEEEIIDGWMELRGPLHLDTLTCLANYVLTLCKLHPALVEELAVQVVRGLQRVTDLGNVTLLRAMSNLEGIYRALGKSEEADKLAEVLGTRRNEIWR